MSAAGLPGPPSALDEVRFVEAYGAVYEDSPWVARAAWRSGLERRHDAAAGLATAMAAVVDGAAREQRLALINTHPDLAGRAALAGELGADSAAEQAGAGIDQCTPEELERFHDLNERYRQRFGFTFVMAVKGSNRHDILAAFDERLGNSPDAEFARAVAEIHKIARWRLEAMADAAEPGFLALVDLAQPRLGSRVVFATDDFFADKSRLIEPKAPVFVPDKYDDNGKWMDGWESRRKRGPGHDYCIVRLGVPGVIAGFDIDTSHFTGNYPPAASIDGCISSDEIPPADAGWDELVARLPLTGDSHHYPAVAGEREYTHVRLNIYPDGGVARLRVYGEIRPDFDAVDPATELDLLALENGGRALACNDEHFGSMRNLNAPDRGVNMGDGWETARRRTPGNDWVLLALGHPGRIAEALIDTAHFKGNYPDRASLRAALTAETDTAKLIEASADWPLLLPAAPLTADSEHRFATELEDLGPVSHVRLDIYPDGGVSRLRLNGFLERGR